MSAAAKLTIVVGRFDRSLLGEIIRSVEALRAVAAANPMLCDQKIPTEGTE